MDHYHIKATLLSFHVLKTITSLLICGATDFTHHTELLQSRLVITTNGTLLVSIIPSEVIDTQVYLCVFVHVGTQSLFSRS